MHHQKNLLHQWVFLFWSVDCGWFEVNKSNFLVVRSFNLRAIISVCSLVYRFCIRSILSQHCYCHVCRYVPAIIVCSYIFAIGNLLLNWLYLRNNVCIFFSYNVFFVSGVFIYPVKIPRNRRQYLVDERHSSIANKIFIRFNRAALFSRTAAVRVRYFHLV